MKQRLYSTRVDVRDGHSRILLSYRLQHYECLHIRGTGRFPNEPRGRTLGELAERVSIARRWAMRYIADNKVSDELRTNLLRLNDLNKMTEAERESLFRYLEEAR